MLQNLSALEKEPKIQLTLFWLVIRRGRFCAKNQQIVEKFPKMIQSWSEKLKKDLFVKMVQLWIDSQKVKNNQKKERKKL